MLMPTMAQTIRRLRRERGLTQDRLARTLGITPAAVSKWETASALPDIGLLGPLAAALGTTTDALLGYEPEMGEERADELVVTLAGELAEGRVQRALAEADRLLAAHPASLTLAFRIAGELGGHALDPRKDPDAGLLARCVELFERCRAEGNLQMREAASYVLAGHYAQAGDHDRARTCLADIVHPVADPRVMEVACLATAGHVAEARALARAALAEKERELELLRQSLASLGDAR